MIDENTNINTVCLIQWFGPFSPDFDSDAKDKCRNWVKEEGEEKEFNFYLVCGKEYGKGKRKSKFYCGITRQRNIFMRFQDPSHPTNTLKVEELWVGRFSDEKLRKMSSNSKKSRTISKIIEQVEWGLIYFFTKAYYSDFEIFNDKKTKNKPNQSVCIVNQWYDINSRINKLNRRFKIQKWVPDVIMFDKDDCTEGLWKYSDRLKPLY